MARDFFSRFLRQDQAQTKLKRGVRRARRLAARGTDLRFESLEDRRMLAAGALDTTFNPSGTLPPGTLLPSGQQGVVIGHFGSATAQAEAFSTVQLPSGKILVAGRYQTTAAEMTRNFAVWRYNVDGTLDTTFGNSDADGIAGMATVDVTPGQPDFALDMAVDSLGRIVAVGRAGNGVDAAVVRLTAAGALDTSFSGDGIATTSSGTDEWQANSVAIDANDFIVVAGYVDKSIVGGDDFLVLRYTDTGTLDTSFDGDGIVTIGFNPSKDDQAFDVAIQGDGKIVVGGTGQIAASAVRDFALARLNTNGSLDNTFGTDFTGDLVPDGKLLSEVSTTNDTIEAIALQSDGKIVAAGSSSSGFAIIARYGANGALDTSTFGVGNPLPGTLRINLDSLGGTTETSLGLAIQGDGKYVVAGRFVSSGDNGLMVARATTSGALDTTFNGGGPFAGGTITNLYSGTINENFRDVIVQSDGKILAVGQGNNSDLVLARYESGQLAAEAGGPYAINEPGGSVVLAGTGVGSGTLTYVWDLDNDGIFGEAAGPGLYGDENGQTPTFNAALSDGPAAYPITLRVLADVNGDLITDQTAEDTATVTIGNVAPTAVFANGGAVDEGSTGSVSFSGQFDPSPADTTAGFRYAYDFNNDGIWDVGDGGYGGSAAADSQVVPAAYLADGAASLTVKGRILDDDGGFTDYTTTIAVSDVAPTLVISGAANVDEGSVYTLTLSASDPGLDAITSWTINWGDSVEVVAGDPGSVTHTYADGATGYVVSATATNEDSTFSSNSIAVTVDNVAPALAVSGAASVDEGSVYTLSLQSSDVGTDTITSWTINWGDSVEVVAGNPGSVTHTYADGSTSYTISATATDEDGSFASNSIGVAVNDVSPTLAISGAASVDEGSVYTLSLSSSDPGADTITSWTINWGDSVEVVTGNPGSVTHTYADGSASYVISAMATDEDGTYAANTVAVTVANVAPTANIGGPYTVGEGGSITLSATGSDAAGAADPLTFEWDLDNNGSYETSGASPVFSAAGLDGPTARTINLRVSDGDGGVTLATTTVSIVNVAPTADAGGPYLTFDDTPIVLSGSGNDPAGGLDPLTLSWDLDGDGIFGESGGAATRGNETGANPTFNPTGLSGSYTVTLRVSDGDGGITDDVATVNVLTEGVLLIDGTLYIVGTNSSDIVLVSRTGDTISVCASFNHDNPVTFNSPDVTDIEVRMRGGHDIVLTTANVTQSMTIDGGAGNDLLTGGGGQNLITGGLGHDFLYGADGDDVLLGGSGNDLLSGGTGNDVLVGGEGNDILLGGAGRDLIIGSQDNDWIEGGGDEDILIGGVTIHDSNLSGLDAVMAIWTSAASFTARVNTLKGPGGLLQGGVTVFDDDDGDYINGGAGRDLVFGDTYLWDGAIDLIALQQAQDVLVAVN